MCETVLQSQRVTVLQPQRANGRLLEEPMRWMKAGIRVSSDFTFPNHSTASLCLQYSRNPLKLQGETGKLRWIYHIHGRLPMGLSPEDRAFYKSAFETEIHHHDTDWTTAGWTAFLRGCASGWGFSTCSRATQGLLQICSFRGGLTICGREPWSSTNPFFWTRIRHPHRRDAPFRQPVFPINQHRIRHVRNAVPFHQPVFLPAQFSRQPILPPTHSPTSQFFHQLTLPPVKFPPLNQTTPKQKTRAPLKTRPSVRSCFC